MNIRYQVVTYSLDTGADEKRDYATKQSAVIAARTYLATEDSAAVYDRRKRQYTAIFGNRWWFELENERLSVKYA